MTGSVRDAKATMAHKVATALDTLEAHEGDVALRGLAMLYAEEIDRNFDDETLAKYGPKLQSTLESLGLSPRVRASLKQNPSKSKSRLRAAREAG